ncbi:DUF2252 domain-containing protein [Acanthopleuribacter pedis]|uniref:DUF2252 family protein n=1 Tax=Acanthopleuribacter pedis TaxID=442870 RepID=A0A8J7U6R5_9BACT|nr:DUF2252 family protein [Acanthopleuribacter pedis]MBO1323042.1 DUF2252 family protein [Acanthopleuribacter pedis]
MKNSSSAGDTQWRKQRGRARKHILEVELARVNGGLREEDRREKYRRMSLSPFAFYRGTAHLFYRDLAAADLLANSRFLSENTNTWIQGDLHINNFGAFADAEGDVVFDLNDFDESWITHYLFDVWRGACSLYLQSEANTFKRKHRMAFIDEFTHEYLNELEIARGKEGRNLDKVTIDQARGPLKKFLTKAITRNSRQAMLEDWTLVEGTERRFNLDDPLLEPITNDDLRLLRTAIKVYKDHLDSDLRGNKDYFKVQDAALRIHAGVGSLGTPRYYVLIRGEDNDPHTCRILDVKQQGLPSFFPFLEQAERDRLLEIHDESKSGQRVAEAQKAMLMDAGKHLGSITILGRSFSVRERSPFKKSFKLEKLNKRKDFHDMAHHWGTILAGGHARGDGDYDSQRISHIFEEAVTDLTHKNRAAFQEEVRLFAESYAKQVSIDFALFCKLRDQGSLG